MNKELEIKLVNKYPNILKDYGGDMKATCMHWGMECGDGWYDLLDKLLAKLDYLFSVSGVQVIADQIKEKYGTLRFYYHEVGGANSPVVHDIIENVITMAENMSERVCENTGKDGVLCTRGGWYKTLSYEEARKEGYKAYNKDLEEYWKEKDKKQDL